MKIKLAHTADWHIRALSRHDEYAEVFKNLRSSLQEKGVDYLFIAGDIWHTKLSNISPEYINFLHNTLRSLSEVCEVRMMLGNHDANLANPERADAISPIVDLMANPRVQLHRTSGTYPLNSDVDLCVFSVLDPEVWNTIIPTDKYSIACFHGAIRGSTTASGWEMEGEKSVSDFDDFDILLLGDIHKFQHMGDSVPPRAAYPGSLIQQSFDEDLIHGYLLWEIDTETRKHTVEFVEVQGAKPFITINANDENYRSILLDSSVASDTRCRVICDDLTTVQKSSLKESLASSGAHEIVVMDNPKSAKIVKKQIAKAVKLDGIDPIIDQAKHYFKNNVRLEVPWKSVESEIRSYAEKLNFGSVRPHRWTLGKFEFDNLYSYGEGNNIDFSKLEGLVGIFGSNAVGKSSVLGSLMYTLFNSSDRDCSKNAHYINDLKDSARASAEVEVDGKMYEMERTTTRSAANRDASSTKLQLRSKDVNLTGEQRNDTDKLIKDLLGSVEDFSMTSMAAQEDLGRFVKEGSTARKEIVSRFLGIDCLSDLHSLAKKDMNALKTERKLLGTDSIESLTQDLEGKKLLLISMQEDLKSKESDHARLEKEVGTLEVELSRSGGSRSRSSIQADLSTKERELRELPEKIRRDGEDVGKHRDRLNDIDRRIQALDELDISSKLREAVELKDSLATARAVAGSGTDRIKSAERSALRLSEVPCGDQFPQCKFIADAHKDKASLEKLRKDAEKSTVLVESLVQKMSSLGIEDLIAKGRSREQLINEREQERSKISTLESSLRSSEEWSKKLSDLVHDLRSQLESIDDAKVEKLSSVKMSLSKIRYEINEIHSKLGSLKKEIEIDGKKLQDCRRIDDRMDILDAILEIFSKDGLPRFVMSQHLDHINSRMSDLLAGIVNFTVDLRMDSEKGNLDITIVKDGRRRLAELGSGMERSLVSLALRVALRDISCIPMPDFLIIDEGFSMLDSDNVQACRVLFQELKKIFRFIIIMTHNDAIKEMVDTVIEVTMSGDHSRIDGRSK